MHPLVDKVRRFASDRRLLVDRHVMAGLSGGVDSIVLVNVLHELGYDVTAVHVNFGLRGAASDADEAFVREWCTARSLSLVVRTVDAASVARARKRSVQHAARQLRYDTFREEALRAGFRTVALGHHRDDQAETILLNLFRGTGIEGLAGMPPARPLTDETVVVRPLLCVSRDEIEDYAREKRLSFREDETNLKTVYRRGALRAEILPLVERYFGTAVPENVARAGDLVRAYLEAGLTQDVRQAFNLADRSEEGGPELDADALEGLPPVLCRRVVIEAIRRWLPGVEVSARMADDVASLLTSQPGRRLEFGDAEVWRDRDRLVFFRRPAGNIAGMAEDEVFLRPGDSVAVSAGTVSADVLEKAPECLEVGSPETAYADRRRLRFPLRVRPWRPGDRFRPLGMAGSKKISDFLTDEHVPSHSKHDVYVVESDGRIVWVVGLRIAHGVRVRGGTTSVVRLTFRPHRPRPERYEPQTRVARNS